MNVKAIKTRVFLSGECLFKFICECVPREQVQEKMLLCVTSKIMSLSENRFVPVASIEKEELVRRESDKVVCQTDYGFCLTLSQGRLVPSAGIDESNSPDGHYILYPKNPYRSLERLHKRLREFWDLDKFAIILSDSKTSPLTRGVCGFALAHWGFKALRDMRGENDLFGRSLKVSTIANHDALAAAAVWCMGEGAESKPLALITDCPLEWTDHSSPEEWAISPREDIYQVLHGSDCVL